MSNPHSSNATPDTIKSAAERLSDIVREWGTGIIDNLARVGGSIADVVAGPRVKIFDLTEAGGKHQPYKTVDLAKAKEVLGGSRYARWAARLAKGYYWAGDAERRLHNLVCNGPNAQYSPGFRVTGPNWVPNQDGPGEGHEGRLVFFRIDATGMKVRFMPGAEPETLGPAGVICEVIRGTNPTPAAFKRWLGLWEAHLADPDKVDKPPAPWRDWYQPLAVWQPGEADLLEWERAFHLAIAEMARTESGVTVQDASSGLTVKTGEGSQWVGMWAEATRAEIALGDLLGAEQNVDDPSGPRSIGSILLG